jgi:acyl-CoA thioester hydrolase
MARVKIDMPAQLGFHTQLPVTVKDVNYGGHVGNDSILSFVHEARIRLLASIGFKELDKVTNTGLIMADAALIYKGEGFHGDVFDIAVGAADFSPFGFDLYYRITTQREGNEILIAEAKSGMIYFDYTTRKVARLPELWKEKLSTI